MLVDYIFLCQNFDTFNAFDVAANKSFLTCGWVA